MLEHNDRRSSRPVSRESIMCSEDYEETPLADHESTKSGDVFGGSSGDVPPDPQSAPANLLASGTDTHKNKSDSTPPESTAASNIVEEPLGQDVLQLIGDRLKPERILLPAIHKDLAVRVEEIINKGLPAAEKKTLLQKFPPPQNGLFMDPPKLNFEIKANIPDSIVKRDDRIVEKQSRISASLAGITKLMSMALQLPQDQKLDMLEILGGVSRILADLQHEESEIRRSLILKNIDISKRDILKSTSSSDLLFGGNLDEKFKAARLLESSSKILKSAAQSSSISGSKNSKGPSRRPRYKPQSNSTTSGQKTSTSVQKPYWSRKQPKQGYSNSKK